MIDALSDPGAWEDALRFPPYAWRTLVGHPPFTNTRVHRDFWRLGITLTNRSHDPVRNDCGLGVGFHSTGVAKQ